MAKAAVAVVVAVAIVVAGYLVGVSGILRHETWHEFILSCGHHNGMLILGFRVGFTCDVSKLSASKP